MCLRVHPERKIQMNKEKETQNEGNQPGKNKTEQLKIAGKPTKVQYGEDGEVSVENPEGLEGKELEEWQKKAQDEISALARANKKGYDANRKLEEIEAEKKKVQKTWKDIQKEKAELQKMKNNLKTREINQTPDIRKELGVKTYEEVRDIMDSEPEKYFKAFDKVNSKSISNSKQMATSQAQKTVLRNQITAEGYDPEEVEAFCDGYLSAPFTRNGFEVYKRFNSNDDNTTTDDIANIQKQKISFINKGDESQQQRSLTQAELEKMSVAEIKEYYAKLAKK